MPDRNDTNGEMYEIQYMNAMQNLSMKYPKDADILSWYGQAIMDTMPWNYYITPSQPKNLTYLAIDTFDKAIRLCFVFLYFIFILFLCMRVFLSFVCVLLFVFCGKVLLLSQNRNTNSCKS